MKGQVIWCFLASLLLAAKGCDQNGPLGMITGEIQDGQITASSSYPQEWDKGCHEKFARIYQPNGKGWCAKYKSSSEWLQVDLGVAAKVTGVMTQGRGDGVEWVTSFKVSYSVDGVTWKYVEDQYGNQRLFEGNTDSYSVKHSYLDSPVKARYVKFHTVHWNRHPSMRVEVIGCQRCKQLLALPPYGKLTASSSHPFRKHSSCQPADGHILSNKAWCSRRKDDGQWLQYDIGPPTTITGLVTKGRGDTGRKHWVKQFRLSYSNDSRIWYYYKEEGSITQPKTPVFFKHGANSSQAPLPDTYSPDGLVFSGNVDKHHEHYHYLSTPFIARYIRFHPIEWEKAISMRAGLIGCPHHGQCGEGFIRVNKEAPCVENLAYRKQTWINNKRHNKRHTSEPKWIQAHAARAVDGILDNKLPSCTILDNHYVDKPTWMVDLGFRTSISGVKILTWQGEGKRDDEKSKDTYKDYMYNLDKLAVYVDNKANIEDVTKSKFCGQVSRRNNALFKPELHVSCSNPIKGRYVYIEAWGVPNGWSRFFSAVLCEVMVYS